MVDTEAKSVLGRADVVIKTKKTGLTPCAILCRPFRGLFKPFEPNSNPIRTRSKPSRTQIRNTR